jgi:hypothetical protein
MAFLQRRIGIGKANGRVGFHPGEVTRPPSSPSTCKCHSLQEKRQERQERKKRENVFASVLGCRAKGTAPSPPSCKDQHSQTLRAPREGATQLSGRERHAAQPATSSNHARLSYRDVARTALFRTSALPSPAPSRLPAPPDRLLLGSF